jgi:hypothetical protein
MYNDRLILLSPSFLLKFFDGFSDFFPKFVFVGKFVSEDVSKDFDLELTGSFSIDGCGVIEQWKGYSSRWIRGASFLAAIHHGYKRHF